MNKRHEETSGRKTSRGKMVLKDKTHMQRSEGYESVSQSYGFTTSHVWMWELDYKEGWAPKNWCFWIVVRIVMLLNCPRLLRAPWTARRSNQSILKEISPEYSLEGLMLKLQYFGYLMPRANSMEKTLMQQKIETRGEESDRGWDGWMASLTQWTWVWANSER